MPEGDTIFRTAANLRTWLEGRAVTAVRARAPGLPVRAIVGATEPARAEAMLSGGWVDEVAQLREAGVAEDAPGMSAVGYPDVVALAAGRTTRADALARIVRATRQFAKRQRTWFRAVPEISWLRVESEKDLGAAAGRVADSVREELAREGSGAG